MQNYRFMRVLMELNTQKLPKRHKCVPTDPVTQSLKEKDGP